MAVDANLGRANIAVRATLDKLDGDLSQARGHVDSTVAKIAQGAQGAGKGFQQLGKLAIGGLGAATAAVGGLGAALGKLTLDAAPVEGVADAFEGLAESAGYGADEMVAALQRGSSGMISQRDLMMSFNKAASLVSTDFAVQLPDAMQYLSKVAASTGQDMGFLMDSLVTGVGRLSPMILDNLSIQVSQAEATERAAEMFGVEADALTKTQQQAGMMNVVLDKLAANTASMPDVTDSAAAGLARMRARFQDVKDRIGMAFLPALNDVLSVVADLADRALPPLLSIIDRLAPIVSTVTGAIADFFWMLDAGIEPMGALKITLSTLFGQDVADKVMNIVASIQEFLGKVQEAVAPVVQWVSENVKLQDVLIVLGAAIASVVIPALGSIISAAAPVIAVFVAGVAIVAALRSAWETDFLGIRTFVIETFQAISTWVTGTLIPRIEALRAKWSDEVWPMIQTVTENVWTVVSGIFEEIGRWINDNIVPWVEALRAKWSDEVWPAIQSALETAWDVIESVWDALLTWMDDTLPGGLEGLKATWERIMNAISSAISPVKETWDKLVSAVKGFWDWISSKTFKFDISLPDLPDWATPGSPLPIHTAWSNFADDMNHMTISPSINLGGDMRERVIRDPGETFGARSGSQTINIYGLTLEGVQDRRGLLDELQALT